MSTSRRTIIERVEAIFKYIDLQNQPFAKSKLKEIGLNPKAAEKWLDLIEYIQSQPKIRVIKTEHNTIIEKLEGKYQAVLRRRIMDQNLSFEDRVQTSEDYLKALYTREQIGLERFSKEEIKKKKHKKKEKTD